VNITRQRSILAAALILGFAIAVRSQPAVVWTQHNDNARVGWSSVETALTPSNVNQKVFGKLFSYQLDDETFSQPLYIPTLKMTVADQKTHNVVFVTTVNNTVYGWDADSNLSNGGQPLWKTNLTPSGATVPDRQYYSNQGVCGGNYNDFAGKVGMVGTPVIDTSSNRLYVVAHTIESGAHVQRLYVLDIASGNKLQNTVISGSYQGNAFNPEHNNQRPALALVNGVVYVGWSSYCDWPPYAGWVIGYRTSDLTQVFQWSSTLTQQGGFWQSGQGIMADSSNNLYLMTGNGGWNGTNSFGMSAVRLWPGFPGFPDITSFFTPGNYQCLNSQDMDFGSAGPMFLPGTDLVPGGGLVVGGGKEGVLYLMHANSLGGYKDNGGCNFGGDNVIQEFQAVFPNPTTATMHIHGGPAFYYSGSHQYLYVWGENDYLRAYEFLPGSAPHFNSTAAAQSAFRAPQAPFGSTNGGMPGGFLSVSSNGSSNGIVWGLAVYACNANQHIEPGILYAFDAANFTGSTLNELWDSRQNGSRDDVGYFAKFTYPTVANGKVYAGGWGPVSPLQPPSVCAGTVPANVGALSVYGLLTSADLTGAFSRGGIVTDGTTITNGGLDGLNNAYSANLLGTSLTFSGATFLFGPANASNAVSARGQTITLRPGQFSALGMLATGVNGSQQNQTFQVKYTDGTTQNFTQSLSDWFSPSNYPGESKALTMPYRDTGNGTEDTRTFYLYGYNFSINSSKTVQSVTVPNNGNVVVLAISLH